MDNLTFQPIQGMSDLAAPEIFLWQRLESAARDVMRLWGFNEVRTPALEYTHLFTRSLGDTTDVVQKEMYSFEDRGGRSLTLRPEGTAGVIRHVSGLGAEGDDARLYYIGPMFRSERPQAGRKRQFHQLGVEAFGAPNPAADAEVIALQLQLFEAWGLQGHTLDLNTRGVPEDRDAVTKGLSDAARPHLGALCEDCQRRFETNILRLLDCKKESCQQIVAGLPPTTQFMGEASRKYLEDVLRLLGKLGINAKVNPRLVRGLDYYVHTVWEIRHGALGAQDALAGGGRYQVALGDKTFQGVGFERAIMAVQKDNPAPATATPQTVAWLVALGDAAREANLQLAKQLRCDGIACGMELGARSMKAQMRAANKSGAKWVVIRGDNELNAGTAALKNLADGAQQDVPLAELPARLKA
ncbi:MAG: histidine--tRNA ligase [Kiritimatiellaeota bacterium]|nr:histidine--tRNA ligase [Kiritimatiellota bacterium]